MAKIDRGIVYNKFNQRCAYCGLVIDIKEMQVDHVIPQANFNSTIKNKFHVPEFLNHLAEFDLNHIDNLFPSCRVCNNWKSTFHLELFRHELQEQIKRLNKNISSYRIAKKYNLVTETNQQVKFYFETTNQ